MEGRRKRRRRTVEGEKQRWEKRELEEEREDYRRKSKGRTVEEPGGGGEKKKGRMRKTEDGGGKGRMKEEQEAASANTAWKGSRVHKPLLLGDKTHCKSSQAMREHARKPGKERLTYAFPHSPVILVPLSRYLMNPTVKSSRLANSLPGEPHPQTPRYLFLECM